MSKEFAPRELRPSDKIIARMPPLRGVGRDANYDPEQSRALQWIATNCGCSIAEAASMLRRASSIGAVRFNHRTREWRGTGMVFVRIENFTRRTTRRK